MAKNDSFINYDGRTSRSYCHLRLLLAHTKVFRQFLRKQQGYKGKAVLIFIFLFLALLVTTRELKFKERLFEMKIYY